MNNYEKNFFKLERAETEELKLFLIKKLKKVLWKKN